MKIMKKLFAIFLFLAQTVTFANCTPTAILDLIGNVPLANDYDKYTIRDETIEVCIYQMEDTRGEDYAYKLLSDNRVVYCGVTNRNPRERAMEHSNVNSKDYKEYDKMIAVGYFKNGKVVRKKETDCVCKHAPKYNKRPTCRVYS